MYAVHARLIAGSVALISAALLGTVTFSITPAPSASADPCPDIEVVFARGTGEPPGLGRVGDAFVDSLRSQVGGRSVGAYAVNYPATKNVLHAAAGANDATGHINYMAANCPDTRLVLGGYSQGAAVVDAMTGAPMLGLGLISQELPPAAADHIAAVAVFGNPSNRLSGGPLSALSPVYGARTIDLCNGDDPVCSKGGDVSAHSLYVQSGMASQAASFVARLV